MHSPLAWEHVPSLESLAWRLSASLDRVRAACVLLGALGAVLRPAGPWPVSGWAGARKPVARKRRAQALLKHECMLWFVLFHGLAAWERSGLVQPRAAFCLRGFLGGFYGMARH